MQIAFVLSIFLAVLCMCRGEELFKQCQKKFGVTEAELDSIPRDQPIESLSLKLKCYAKCTIADILGDDGKLVVERVGKQKGLKCKEQFDSYVINNEEESCDYAAKILNCLH
ncbi:uncharacterized protein LOC133841903 [Drosophila sulfurigaster albostrigata]|uniref:uncharacterized protein LOC133841903 n=1 Tax=Drosophila sulfurigaster albostrigata TaxID=89887 RepID=UPI002D218ADE|nr:uncharacterized protein LOC133841903 [Drosophila sulfurigaster albostrigata]